MTAQEIVNYYLNHPPVDVSDPAAYQELMQIVVNTTLTELSECDPILEEKEFTTPSSADPYVYIDLYQDIDERFMDFVILYPKDNPPVVVNDVLYRFRMNQQFYGSGFRSCATLIDIMAMKDYRAIIEDWFSRERRKLIFQGSKIKLKPNTTYYCIYKRYRNLDEVPPYMLDPFKRLIGVNLYLEFFSSNILASESEIRSVSISGLSVSFNVPSADTRTSVIMRLKEEKERILSSIAIDYDEDQVGLIY